MSPSNRRPSLRGAFPLARAAWAAWALTLIVGSLFPIWSWSARGIEPFAFLTEPWPRWWTFRDVSLNVAAYLPIGLLGVLGLWPNVRGRYAIVLSMTIGALLSLGLEAMQNWLPTRIPSILDVLANVAGTLMGALIAGLLAPRMLRGARRSVWQTQWFQPWSRPGLLLLGAWVLAQCAPQMALFGAPDAALPWGRVLEWLGETPTPSWLIVYAAPIQAPAGVLIEAIQVIAAMVAIMLVVAVCTRKKAPRAAIASVAIVLALAGRSALAQWGLPEVDALYWVTPGALGGLICGALLALGVATLNPLARHRALVAALITSLLAAQFQFNPGYQNHVLDAWTNGSWRNVAGLLAGLATAWPLLVLFWVARLR
jgi:VanZ family protein